MMIKNLAASALFAFRQPVKWQPVFNVCFCKSLRFKQNKFETDNRDAIMKKTRPKTIPLPKITLLGPDNDLSVVTMDVATKLCERRGLKLVKIIDIDTKTQRPVYQMMTTSQLAKGDRKSDQKKDEKNRKLKAEKTALINCRIGEADLESKVNHFRKWLNKMHEVRVTVSGDSANEVADKIIKMTEDYSRVVQRREKGDTIKFQLLPPKPT